MEQNSQEWYLERWGKFTASSFHKLFSGGKRPMTQDELIVEKLNKGRKSTVETLFGEGAISYIYEKIDEILTSYDAAEMFAFSGNKATDYGHAYEDQAIEQFELRTGIKVERVGFIQIAERLGGSPDGVTEDAIIEVKCPFSSKNHTVNLLIDSVAGLKDEHFDYYIQMQVNMIAAKKEKGYFISYDPRKSNSVFQMKIIEVPKDEQVCKEILFRYQEAMKVLSGVLEKLYKMI